MTRKGAGMAGIIVSVTPPTDRGRLYPRYVEGAGILAVESRVERPWSFGVDIDGRIVFDLDDERVLANFDVHVPKSRWKSDLNEEVPAVAPPGDLAFSAETIAIRSFTLPLRVRTDRLSRRLRIEFGRGQADRAVTLSASCIALLSASELVGFAIKDFA
jgi:hypothetical protein